MPIILVTAKADPDDIVAGLDAGGDEYITKPVDHAALVARVRSILRIKALHDVGPGAGGAARGVEPHARAAGRGAARRDRAARARSSASCRRRSPTLVAAGDEHLLESHRREITVVFCDLRGFTAFAETSEPEEVMGVLRQYHEALGELIFHHEGTRRAFRRRWRRGAVQRSPALPGSRPRARCAWRSRCARASPSSPKPGAGKATISASASASPRATPRSAGSASRAGSTTRRSARSRTWPRACATRPADGEILISQRALAGDRGSGRGGAGGRPDAQGLCAPRYGVPHPASARLISSEPSRNASAAIRDRAPRRARSGRQAERPGS